MSDNVELIVIAREDHFLVSFVSPRKLVGQKLLARDRSLWLLTRAHPKPMPISPQQRRHGVAAYSELVSQNFLQDYHIKRLPDAIVDGTECYAFSFTASADVPFSQVKFWIKKETTVPFRAKFHSVREGVTYDVSYETANTIERSGVVSPFVSKITIVSGTEKAVLEYTDVELDRFSPTDLHHVRLDRSISSSVEKGLDEVAKIWQNVEHDIRAVTFVDFEQPSMTNTNPGNLVYNLPETIGYIELRPDFAYEIEKPNFILGIKPRFTVNWEHFASGVERGSNEYSIRVFINEFAAEVREIVPGLSFTVERDNLQWGPAYLGSPSNIFFRDNGRTEPLFEIHGADFFDVLWAPVDLFSISYIDNFGDGAQEPQDFGPFQSFERSQVLKFDFLFPSSAISLIVGNRDDDRAMFGVFGQWTAADAILVYFDSAFRRGSSALYPVLEEDNPVGGLFAPTKFDQNTIFPEVLVGASYTTNQNFTFYGEYLYYGPGYSKNESREFNTLVDRAAELVLQVPPNELTELGFNTLGAAFFNKLRWRGRHQGLFQLTKSFGDLALVSHNVFDLLDQSGYLFVSATYTHRRHVFVGTAQYYFGDESSEYRSIFDYEFTVGYQYLF